ncbi:uncharacterized protein [Montipora capricornis]|uniref:uncharacterized protein n=1 Tax=Montipora foliosa TaxID=591990 RepID=UPI0035F1AC33
MRSFKFHKQEVTHVGHVFGTDSLRPSPDQVQAILSMPVPHDKSSLQKFMRMVNYLHNFIPHLADINKRLRELLEKSVEWHWMKRQQKAYQELVNSIMQRMLRVQHYDLKVNYVPGNQLLIADTLSRASQSESTLSTEEFEVHLLIKISKQKGDEWKRKTASDPVLYRFREVVLSRWPENRAELAPQLRKNWNFRDDLCICDGLLMNRDRLIPPSGLRSEILDKIHSSHLGGEKCLNRARETVYCMGWSMRADQRESGQV